MSAARVVLVGAVLLLLSACGSAPVLRHVPATGASVATPTPGPTLPTTGSVPSTSPSRPDPIAPTGSDTATPRPSASVSASSSGSHGRSAYPPVDAAGLIPVIHRIQTADPVVFVTIDDGATTDPRVLDLLRRRHVPVTPFLTSAQVQRTQDYFRAVQTTTGQHVQDHTIDHPDLKGRSLATQTAQVCGAAASYSDWFGTRPWLFRPPYGSYDDTTRRAAAACGMRALVLWDVSLPHAVLRYAGTQHLQPGDIILTHWRPDLYRDLAGALDAVTAAGLRVAALQDYLPATG